MESDFSWAGQKQNLEVMFSWRAQLIKAKFKRLTSNERIEIQENRMKNREMVIKIMNTDTFHTKDEHRIPRTGNLRMGRRSRETRHRGNLDAKLGRQNLFNAKRLLRIR